MLERYPEPPNGWLCLLPRDGTESMTAYAGLCEIMGHDKREVLALRFDLGMLGQELVIFRGGDMARILEGIKQRAHVIIEEKNGRRRGPREYTTLVKSMEFVTENICARLRQLEQEWSKPDLKLVVVNPNPTFLLPGAK